MQTECKPPASCSMKPETLPTIPNHQSNLRIRTDASEYPKKRGKVVFVFRGSYCRFLSVKNSSAPTMAIMIARAIPTPMIVIVLSTTPVVGC